MGQQTYGAGQNEDATAERRCEAQLRKHNGKCSIDVDGNLLALSLAQSRRQRLSDVQIEPGYGTSITRLPYQLDHSRGSRVDRSEEHTSELQSLMRISYAVFCLQKK